MNKVAASLSLIAGVSWLGLWCFGALGNSYLSLSIAVVFLCNGYIFMLGHQKTTARKQD